MTIGNSHMLDATGGYAGYAVYMITNLVTGERYIGCSKNVRKRIFQHEASVRTGKTSNRLVSVEMARLGLEFFRISILKKLDHGDDAYSAEEKIVEALKPEYNVARGGKGRAVRCLDDGRVFKSASECSRYYGIEKSALIEHCGGKGGRQHVGHMRFEYIGYSAIEQVEKQIKVKRLTPDEVRQIRGLLKERTQTELMRQFNVGRDAISDISRGKTWRDLN